MKKLPKENKKEWEDLEKKLTEEFKNRLQTIKEVKN